MVVGGIEVEAGTGTEVEGVAGGRKGIYFTKVDSHRYTRDISE